MGGGVIGGAAAAEVAAAVAVLAVAAWVTAAWAAAVAVAARRERRWRRRRRCYGDGWATVVTASSATVVAAGVASCGQSQQAFLRRWCKHKSEASVSVRRHAKRTGSQVDSHRRAHISFELHD